MGWLTRRIRSDPSVPPPPSPRWMRRLQAVTPRSVERAPLHHGTIVMLEDQDGPIISVATRH
jgi:hypothetical protein